ncbi:hypothetical protein ACFL27_10475 [candidate division CSSED10-310 bacterium]|uniref:DUF3592 domain-containing protein n=1 Tax=candidate division CSSED10-310 bacterium TaxID=2855610 RepID=A0ABV6YWZ1_UNCC1
MCRTQLDITDPKKWLFILTIGTIISVISLLAGIYKLNTLSGGTPFDAYVTRKNEKHPGSTTTNSYYITFHDPVDQREKTRQVDKSYYHSIQVGDRITVVYGDYSYPDSNDYVIVGAESYRGYFLPIGLALIGWILYHFFFSNTKKEINTTQF